MLAYQYGGSTSKGSIPTVSPDWKCFQISLIKNLEELPNDRWHYAPTKGNPQTCVKQVDYRVEN